MLKVKDLKTQSTSNSDDDRAILYCEGCGYECSANKSDYILSHPERELICGACDDYLPLRRVVKQVKYVDV